MFDLGKISTLPPAPDDPQDIDKTSPKSRDFLPLNGGYSPLTGSGSNDIEFLKV
jgi:hypothetical protein